MKNTDCTVLVCSCDKYHDVEKPFIALWRKFWPDCPFETVLLSETLSTEGFDRAILTGGEKTWCEMLAEALEKIESPYVLMLMNDYFLNAPVETAAFLRRLDEAKRFNAASLRLNPMPPGQKPWEGSDLLEMPKNVAYCVTCQASIWNKGFLQCLARRNKSAWEFERYGSFMVGDEKHPLLVTPTKEFPFVDAVHKGHWETFGLAVCRENDIDLTGITRTLPPFKIRLIEGVKGLIFRMVPTTLLVRFQNRFDLGAKETPAGGASLSTSPAASAAKPAPVGSAAKPTTVASAAAPAAVAKWGSK